MILFLIPHTNLKYFIKYFNILAKKKMDLLSQAMKMKISSLEGTT